VKITADNVNREMIRLAMESVAETAIIPMQDVLGLGEACRMNTPASANGNWTWRLRRSEMTPEAASFLAGITRKSGRAV
jgi:4-alpha-glucanotransferase